jgi:hypothetical protein
MDKGKKDNYELFEKIVWLEQNTDSPKPNSSTAGDCHSTAIGWLL